MKKAFWMMLGVWMLIMAAISPRLTGPVRADENKPVRPAPSLKVGDVAPDFKLQYFDGKELKHVSLSGYRGKKNVVLAFYVFAFTGG
jgi:AhpC/TSA family protein